MAECGRFSSAKNPVTLRRTDPRELCAQQGPPKYRIMELPKMFTRKPVSRPEVIWVGYTLTWTAGFVDAIAYLTLRQIYVANMSGNTVAVGIHISVKNWVEVWAHACPIVTFFPGLIFGAAVVEWTRRSSIRPKIAPAILIEAAILGLFVYLANQWISQKGTVQSHSGAIYVALTASLAFSMGMQNGLLRHTGTMRDLHTYVTGTLLAAANGVTNYLFWVARRLRRFTHRGFRSVLRYSTHHRSLRGAAIAGTLWIFYVVGAAVGALTLVHCGINVLIAAPAVLVVVALSDIIKPVPNRPAAA